MNNSEGVACTDIYDIVSDIYHVPLSILYVSIFVVGLVNNGTLLLIYVKHREMRSPHNIMFISLTIADTFFLLVHVGMFRIGHIFHGVTSIPLLGQTNCRVMLFFIGISVGMSPYTLAAISFQRYVRIVRHTNPEATWARSVFTRPATLHATMMLFAVLVAIPNTLCSNFCTTDKSHAPLIYWNGLYPIFFYGVLPAAIIGGCYYASVRKRVAEEAPPGLRKNIRMRTTKVLLSLTVVYVFTFAPVLLCELSRFWYMSPLTCTEPITLVWVCAVGVFLFNPVLNPIALCVASVRIRLYFRYYLLFCFKENRELKKENDLFIDVTVYRREKLRGSTSSQ